MGNLQLIFPLQTKRPRWHEHIEGALDPSCSTVSAFRLTLGIGCLRAVLLQELQHHERREDRIATFLADQVERLVQVSRL